MYNIIPKGGHPYKDNTIITMLTRSTENEHFYMSDLPDIFSNFTDQHLYRSGQVY